MVSEESKCPVNHNQEVKSCPIDHNQNESINPLTQMPYSSTLEAASSVTAEDLSNSREMSTIPRGDTEKLWEYPSPRMFYNALRRKGYETDPADVDMMVDVHNFLNEGVWDEVMKWEKKFHCDCESPELVKFRGRAKDLTPKAKFYSTFLGTPEPFDRHDWTVNRCGKEVRYVIDYYAGESVQGMPSFYCDVRPAVDSLQSGLDRLKMIASENWESMKSYWNRESIKPSN